ncbi:MAG: hypothetical protein NTW86_28380, partial [Candidatus Sumerlaeota bacterium]|nr:hypothetical protein [Candidatus Sumerlaeota bacterium]
MKSYSAGAGVLALLLAAAAHAADTSAPDTPRLRYPKDQEVFHHYPRTVRLEWEPVKDRSGVQYYVEIQTYYPKAAGGVGVWRSRTFGPLADTLLDYVHIGDQQAQWRVWAVDGAGNIGQKSVWRAFTFDTRLQAGANVESQTPRPTPAPAAPAQPAPAATPAADHVVMHTPGPTPAETAAEAGGPAAPAEEGVRPEFLPAIPEGPEPALARESALAPELSGAGGGAPEGSASLPEITPLSPADGAKLSSYPREVTLSWKPASDAGLRYTVEVQTLFPFVDGGGGTSGRSEFYRNVEGGSVQHVPPGDYRGRWRVRAVDGDGREGPPSAWRSFSFDTKDSSQRQEDLKALTMPETGGGRPISRSIAGIPPSVAKAKKPVATPKITPRPTAAPAAMPGEGGAPAPAAETTAAAQDSSGDPRIPIPDLLNPADGAIRDDDEDYVICKWAEVPDARYTLEKQTYDAQTNTWKSEFYRNLSGLSKSAEHEVLKRGRVRIRATIGGVEGPWSAWHNFTYHGEGAATDAPGATSRPVQPAAARVDQQAPPTPGLISPEAGMVVRSPQRAVTLEWSPVSDESGVSYTCVVEIERPAGAANAQPRWESHAFARLRAPRLPYQNPAPGQARWYVVAVDGAGNQSQPTEARDLRFEAADAPADAAPGAVKPLAPSGGAYVAPGQVLFTWTPGAGASQYRVEVQSLAS